MNSRLQGLLYVGNSIFIQEMYCKYIKNRNSLTQEWCEFFDSLNIQTCHSTNIHDLNVLDTTSKVLNAQEFDYSNSAVVYLDSITGDEDISLKDIQYKIDKRKNIEYNTHNTNLNTSQINLHQVLADSVIDKYRKYGHLLTELDPLSLEKPKSFQEVGLDLKSLNVDLSALDIECNFHQSNYNFSELISKLQTIYTKNIGVEFNHITCIVEHDWLYSTFESMSDTDISNDEKVYALESLIELECFEQYLHTKFPGAKRFSCEGSEASIFAIKYTVTQSVEYHNIKDITICMAHRGRLASLSNITKKPYRAIFSEFKGGNVFPEKYDIAGDVKYHMGWRSTFEGENNTADIEILPNPSHLEAVNPVLCGIVRAKQDLYNEEYEKLAILGIAVHGDAAFCGQGVVAETFNMSNLTAYRTKGTIHIVTNNQIGYTANPQDGRSSRYATEFAKVNHIPIIHVNGNAIDDVMRAIKVALKYRQRFQKDIVVDIIGYRKYGHNEGDEPSYTQGVMYSKIKSMNSVSEIYLKKMIESKSILADEVNAIKQSIKNKLQSEFDKSDEYTPEDPLTTISNNRSKNHKIHQIYEFWKSICSFNNEQLNSTGIDSNLVHKLAKLIFSYPSNFNIHRKVAKILESRLDSVVNENIIDWATAESLAFASIIYDNMKVRITGQDAGRGTFAHRHSVLHDQKDNTKYVPLNMIRSDKNSDTFDGDDSYFVADSFLSEYAVLGFEYGYSVFNPKKLVIWEAQFGDFANGAQIMIDQFISSAETKWLQRSGLVMLLPHGYEGQGPEHSSAKLERFLQLCAENNMYVVNPTTPANFFHLLRRQVMGYRRPLIVMSPKSLLRNKMAISNIEDFIINTNFMTIIDESTEESSKKYIKKVVLCTGKIYYDLYNYKNEHNITDTALIRIEQIYPLDASLLKAILSQYTNATKVIWSQEEPQNMGAWSFVKDLINNIMNTSIVKNEIQFVGRKPAASSACGNLFKHQLEQFEVIQNTFK